MQEAFLVLLGDPETGVWTVAVNSSDKEEAKQEFDLLKEDGTPAIFIATGDFVTV
jgi:hypothetical protein